MLLACMLAVPMTAMASSDATLPAQETEVSATEVEEALEESLEATVEEETEVIVETEAEESSENEEELPALGDPTEETAESAEAEESTEEPEEVIPDGFLEKDGKIYYYENNEMVKGLLTVNVDGKKATYYFGEDGAAVTGYKKVSSAEGDAYYYFQKNGQAYADGFLQFIGTNGKTYYFYFGKDGKAYTNGYKSVRNRHKADEKGKITDISDGNSYKYYFRRDGKAYTSGLLEFVHTDGKTYFFYFQEDGKAFNSGLKKAKNHHYADAAGNMKNVSDGESYLYFFQKNGQAFTSGLMAWTNDKGTTYYYYFQKNGQAYTKGYKTAKKIYKANADCTVNKISADKSYAYYFRTSGKAYTGGFLKFVHTNGKTYNFYFNADGKAYTNGSLVVSKRYSADAKGTFTKIPNEDMNKYGYSFNSKGQGTMIQGWSKISDTWCWFDESTGVRKFASNPMHTAWNYIADRSSGTSYFVVVDTTNCLTFTFKGSANNWTPYFLWKCCPGKPSTPTVKGTYSITGRGYRFSGQEYTCYYYTQFYGNYLFHSVLYNRGTFNIRSGTLGKQLSHGCVRLAIENAKWFYDNLPNGSKVYIY